MVNTNAVSSVSSYKEMTTDYQNYGRWINQLEQKIQEMSDEQHRSSRQDEEHDGAEHQAEQHASQQQNPIKADGVNRPTKYHRLDTYV